MVKGFCGFFSTLRVGLLDSKKSLAGPGMEYHARPKGLRGYGLELRFEV